MDFATKDRDKENNPSELNLNKILGKAENLLLNKQVEVALPKDPEKKNTGSPKKGKTNASAAANRRHSNRGLVRRTQSPQNQYLVHPRMLQYGFHMRART